MKTRPVKERRPRNIEKYVPGSSSCFKSNLNIHHWVPAFAGMTRQGIYFITSTKLLNAFSGSAALVMAVATRKP